MIKFEYEDLKFKEKEPNVIRGIFMLHYFFDIDISGLGKYEVKDNALIFERDVERGFLGEALAGTLIFPNTALG